MDVKIINPFLEAAIHVLKTMAGVEPKPGKAFLKKNEAAQGDVSAIITVTGAATGTMSLSFAEPCIKAIVAKLLQTEITEIDDDVRDAVGELTNMICGDARKRLGEQGLSLQAGIPTVVTGKGHTIRHINSGPRLAIPFETDHTGFIVEIVLIKDKYKL